MKRLQKTLLEAAVGGTAYCLLELAYRGRTHPSMFAAGGLCFAAIGAVNRRLPARTCLAKRCLMGCGIITTVEFVTGCVVNLLLKLRVWDYSKQPFNVLGQICLPFCTVWFLLTIPIVYASKVIDNICKNI